MRVAPVFWRDVPPASGKLDLTALVASRANLICGLAGILPTPQIKVALSVATTARKLSRITAGAGTALASCDGAVEAARYNFYAAAAADGASAATVAAYAHTAYYIGRPAGDAARTDGWEAIRNDVAAFGDKESELGIFAKPLWPDSKNQLAEPWSKVRTAWAADCTNNPGWQFWIDWYDAALQGRPLLGDWGRHWALLTDIALIDPKVWNAGPDAVNPKVMELLEKHRTLAEVIARTPNGEIIGLDPETNTLTTVPVPGIDGDLRNHILNSVRKAIERFHAACDTGGASSNFGPALRDCADNDLAYLSEDLADAGGFDVALHDAIDDCLGSLRKKFAEQGLSNDAAADRLIRVLERCTVDIYANSDPAREALEKRGEEYYRRISIEHHTQLNQLAQDMAADSMEAFQRQILADLARADDDTADPIQRRRARYRTISRLPRGAEAIKYSRYVDGRRIADDPPKPPESKLWVATVLAPSFAEILRRYLGG